MEELVADYLYDIPKKYPLVFDLVHYTLCLQSERLDIGNDFQKFAKDHPLACWFSSMMTCFAGSLLVPFICGEPLLRNIIQNPWQILWATLLWYLTFFGPKDLYERYSQKKYVKAPLAFIKGWYYPKKLVAGIKHSKHFFRYNPLAAVIVGTLNANGSGIIKPLARLARGKWTPEAWESMEPSSTTKYCLLCALIYTKFPTDYSYILITLVFVAMKLAPAFDKDFDPFEKAEDKVSPYIFGKGDKPTAEKQENKQE